MSLRTLRLGNAPSHCQYKQLVVYLLLEGYQMHSTGVISSCLFRLYAGMRSL